MNKTTDIDFWTPHVHIDTNIHKHTERHMHTYIHTRARANTHTQTVSDGRKIGINGQGRGRPDFGMNRC